MQLLKRGTRGKVPINKILVNRKKVDCTTKCNTMPNLKNKIFAFNT